MNHRALIQRVICMARALLGATARVIALPFDERDAAEFGSTVFEGMVDDNRPSIAH